MNSIKRVLVALDLSKIDETIISYTSFLNGIIDFDKVYFFHVAKDLELPEAVLEKYPELLAPADETLEDLIDDNISRFFKGKAETDIQVLEGNAEEKIFRWSQIKEIDLIIVGKKSSLKGSGHLPNKLAKHAHCSILTVPEVVSFEMKKVMAAVDFSSSSKNAFQRAFKLIDKIGAHLLIQNTYVVPIGHSKSGKTYEEFAEIIKGHSQAECEHLVKENDIKEGSYTTILSLDDDDEPSDKIYRDAEENDADIIIIASKGRTSIAGFLIGSVADKLLHHAGDIPVMVLKEKKENMGFFEALFRI